MRGAAASPPAQEQCIIYNTLNQILAVSDLETKRQNGLNPFKLVTNTASHP